MKKVFRFAVAFALIICLMQAAALADTPVSVQLDGENIVFTDAEPRIVNDRTFLPLRAVFEAMGAEIGYDKGVITAVRGGRTIVMTVGSAEVSVTENGETETIVMDVAPFIDPALSRTFVPVRFAAQALGAVVGWDAEARTVIIIDTDKLIDKAVGDASFGIIEKLMHCGDRYNEGLWDIDTILDGSVMLAPPYEDMGPVDVRFSASCAETSVASKSQATGTIRADLASLFQGLDEALEDGDEEAAEYAGMLAALADDGVGFSACGDLASGKLYVKPDCSALGGDLAAVMGGDLWFSVDLAEMMSSMELDELMPAYTGEIGVKQLLKAGIAFSGDPDNAEYSYAAISEVIGTLAEYLSDGSFTADGDVYTAEISQTSDDISANLTLSVTFKGDEVSAYSMEFSMNGASDDLGNISADVKGSWNDQGGMSITAVMDMGEMFSCDITADLTITPGSTEPETEPPADAAVLDIMALAALVSY